MSDLQLDKVLGSAFKIIKKYPSPSPTYLHSGGRCILRQTVQSGDGHLQVLAGAHPTHIAMQAAQHEGVAGPRHGVTVCLHTLETGLGNPGHKAGVSTHLGHAAHGLAGGTPEHGVGVSQSSLRNEINIGGEIISQ